MKKIAMLLVLFMMISTGCFSLWKRTTFLPKGQDEYMQVHFNNKETYVRTLVKVEF